MSTIILDLDNCIADDKWRIPHINFRKQNPMERYHDYHSLSGFDQVGNEDLFRDGKHDIAIFTARPVMYHAMTVEWLNRQHIKPYAMLMRDNNDHCHSKDLKRKQLRWLTSLHGVDLDNIFCAYDDRADVVEMYLEHGVPAEVRAIHDVCAYTPPKTNEKKLVAMGYDLDELEKDSPYNQFMMESENANSGQSDGENAGDIQGTWQDLQGQLLNDRRSAGADVSRRDRPQDGRRPQQVASVSADDDQSYPTR